VLRNHPSFPDPELAPERDALNCIRVLTRLLPFLYEADHLEQWEDQFFWAARRKRSRRGQLVRSEVIFDEADPEQTPTALEPEFENAKPLAEEIIDTLVDLLFFSDFTLPKVSAGKNKVSYAIWQSGVGCNTPIASTKEFESNRTEILRLLLTFASKSMYMSAGILPVKGVKAITYLATCSDKQVVLSVLCSLLNTVRQAATFPTAYTDQVDSEVQSCDMARPIRSRSLSRPEADSGHILFAIAPSTDLVSHPRSWQRSCPQELLPPFPRPAAQAPGLPVLGRWHDPYLEPARTCHEPSGQPSLTETSCKQTHPTCPAAKGR
jgi:hypothetical protein